MTRILSEKELKEVEEYAKSAEFDTNISADCSSAQFSVNTQRCMPQILVSYDVSWTGKDVTFISIWWSSRAVDLSVFDRFVKQINFAQEIARRLTKV